LEDDKINEGMMKLKFRLRISLATSAALIAVGCADQSPTGTAYPVSKPMPIPSASHDVLSNYSNSIFTAYDEEGTVYRLDVAAKELQVGTDVIIEIEDANLEAITNEFAGSVVFDNFSNVFESTLCTPENPCGEPMDVPISKLTTTKFKPSKAKAGNFGYYVDLNKYFKEQEKLSRKGTFTLMEWPPNCFESQGQLRDEKDRYKIERRTTLGKLKDIAAEAVVFNASRGKFVIKFAARAALALTALESFVFKDLAQSRVSIMAGLYAGACGNNQLPNTSSSLGNIPGMQLQCDSPIIEPVSFDGGLTYHDIPVTKCRYEQM
jgi:hypothetical protein